MSPHTLEAELRQVMEELDDHVESIRHEARRNQRGHGIHAGWMSACAALGLFAVYSVASLMKVLDGGTWTGATILLPLGAAAVALMTRLWPLASPGMHSLIKHRKALLARKKVLERELASSAQNTPGRRQPHTPLIRRPTDFAQVLWHSGGHLLGPSPAEALRDLPETTPWPRLAYHRYLGWGFPVLLLLTFTVLAIAVSV